MLKYKLDKLQFVIIFGYIISVLSILLLPGVVSMTVNFVYIIAAVYTGYIAVARRDGKAASTVMVMPVFISVAQNIYLGFAAERLNTLSLQVLLSMHFVLFFGIVVLCAKKAYAQGRWAVASVVILTVYSVLLYFVFPSNITSALSSIRNILSCMLLYCFGLIMSKAIDPENYYHKIKMISWFVVIFGFFEWIGGLGVWRALNITTLWEMKGIQTNIGGIPPNWYSSEQIGGSIVRRMVSSFADPVNLGTFLFAAFMIAWYRRDKVLTWALALCALLTVSKGSLLGFLIFIVVLVWKKKKFKLLIPVMGGAALIVGIWFIRYSMRASTGSILAHFWGFVSSFSVLASHPLGLGVGNVGVLAGLFNESLLNLSVSETGIGMVIAQLGIIGIGVYIFFFACLGTAPKHWIENDEREKVLYYSLLLSFLANALFNEVALSPNSCGLFFIEMAFLNRTNKDSAAGFITGKNGIIGLFSQNIR